MKITKPTGSSDPIIIDFVARKGGVGTTTVAAALAARLNEEGFNVVLVDKSPTGDSAAALGASTPSVGDWVDVNGSFAIHYSPSASTTQLDDTYQYIIFDWGTHHVLDLPDDENRHRVLVVANDYMCLRNVVQANAQTTADSFVLVRHPDRVLNERDVAAVLGTNLVDLVTIDVKPEIARALDAGLLSMRHSLIDLSALTVRVNA